MKIDLQGKLTPEEDMAFKRMKLTDINEGNRCPACGNYLITITIMTTGGWIDKQICPQPITMSCPTRR